MSGSQPSTNCLEGLTTGGILKTALSVVCSILILTMNLDAQTAYEFKPGELELRRDRTCKPAFKEDLVSETQRCASEPGEKAGAEKELPDAPIPKPQAPHPEKQYLGNQLHLWDEDRSWGKAFRNPVVLTSSVIFAGLTALQIVKTNRCIDENKPSCNLVTGKNGGLNYGVAIPLTAGIIWSAAKLKEKGKGGPLLLLLMSAFTYEATVAYTANPHLLVCKPDRTPLCQ
jgi:hypothetical protein